MAAFARVVEFGAKTSEAALVGPYGKLKSHELMQDKVLFSMINDGYKWLVISWEIANLIPEWSDFAQRALNSTNSIASECSELEVMSSMAELAHRMIKNKKPVYYQVVIAAATASNPRCSGYAHVLAKCVENYGGGAWERQSFTTWMLFRSNIRRTSSWGKSFSKLLLR